MNQLKTFYFACGSEDDFLIYSLIKNKRNSSINRLQSCDVTTIINKYSRLVNPELFYCIHFQSLLFQLKIMNLVEKIIMARWSRCFAIKFDYICTSVHLIQLFPFVPTCSRVFYMCNELHSNVVLYCPWIYVLLILFSSMTLIYQ